MHTTPHAMLEALTFVRMIAGQKTVGACKQLAAEAEAALAVLVRRGDARASDRNPKGGDAYAAPGRSPESAVRQDAPKQDGAPNNESSSKREAPASAGPDAADQLLRLAATMVTTACRAVHREGSLQVVDDGEANMAQEAFVIALRAALTSAAPAAAPAPTHRHIKTGGLYTEVGRGELQVQPGMHLFDLCPVAVYRGQDGRLWVRTVADFDDPRRFDRLATPPQAEAPALEVRCNEDGSLDEVVGSGRFHLEQMSDTHWWMEFEDASGNAVHVNFHGQITASYEREQNHG